MGSLTTEIEYFNLQLLFMTAIVDLSFDTLTVLAGYLKAEEIARLSQTSTHFRTIFQIKILKVKRTHSVQNQENANIFYLHTQIQDLMTLNDKIYHLQLVRFNMVTKDQGWVKDCESGSWIEAEFLEKEPQKGEIQPDSFKQESKRIHLVHNYQVREYQKKRKILSLVQIPEGSTHVRIYLRSSGDNWKVSCQQIEVEKLYCPNIKLNPKQFETFSLRKKPSQRTHNQIIRNRRRGLTSL